MIFFTTSLLPNIVSFFELHYYTVRELKRMKLVCNHTVLILLPSRKNILLKINIGYTNTDTEQIKNTWQQSAVSLPSMPPWLGTQQYPSYY